MNNVNELLPIGTVVLLKNGEKKLMIFGVKQTNKEDGMEYDYIGVMYPEGYFGAEYQFLFNNSDIQRVVYKGYENEERVEFISKLSDFYNNEK